MAKKTGQCLNNVWWPFTLHNKLLLRQPNGHSDCRRSNGQSNYFGGKKVLRDFMTSASPPLPPSSPPPQRHTPPPLPIFSDLTQRLPRRGTSFFSGGGGGVGRNACFNLYISNYDITTEYNATIRTATLGMSWCGESVFVTFFYIMEHLFSGVGWGMHVLTFIFPLSMQHYYRV